jgi:3-deoxy-D-manno-octulosonate cytidylyltransferase
MQKHSNDVVIIIPSRYESQRLPKKPLVKIAGKSLVERVFTRCRHVDPRYRVVVATDHVDIKDAVEALGGEVVMTSPDCASGTDRIEEAARLLGLKDQIVINVQGDEPLIEPSVVQAVIDALCADSAVQVATAVSLLKNTDELLSPNVVKAVLATSGDALYFSRSPIPFNRDHAEAKETWANSHTYYKHIGIYGYRLNALTKFVQLGESGLERVERLEQLRFLEAGIGIRATLVEYDSVAVDTIEDVRSVERIILERGLE